VKSLLAYKVQAPDLEVEFEVLPSGLDSVQDRLSINAERLEALDKEIDHLTSEADKIDYMVAVGSGLLAGLVDSLWVGKFDFDRGNAWGSDRVNSFVMKMAKKQGYTGDDLEGAIRHLEYIHVPSDSVMNSFGGSTKHHLRDFAHHPTPVGLAFSLLTQFTCKAYGTNTQGVFQIVDVTDTKFIGQDIPQKIILGTVYWFLHMVSDMAGSSKTPGAGTGLPGPLVSLLQEISALPIFKKMTKDSSGNDVKAFSKWVSDTFKQFDLRAEIGVGYELGRQAIPVLLNECIVRGFYFIRQLVKEIKEKNPRSIKDLKKINWRNTLPFNNRTIIRMLTISCSTFTLVDLTDAAIRGAIESGANSALFAKEFLLRVNYIGVGRFVVAITIDAAWGIKLNKRRNERIAVMGEQYALMDAKVFYLQADNWVAAETTAKTIAEAEETMKQAVNTFVNTVAEVDDCLNNVGTHIDDVSKSDPLFIEEMKDTLMWG